MDKEEKDIISSFERGEWRSSKKLKIERRKYEERAKAASKKDKRVNIRLAARDLEGIQKRAIEEGIPCQTLIGSIIHKYVTGKLVDKKSEQRAPANAHSSRRSD